MPSDTTNPGPSPKDTHGYPTPGAFILLKKTAHHAREYARLVDSFAADLDEFADYLAKPGRRTDDPDVDVD